MAPTTTVAARTTSGWPGARRWSRTCCRCSSRCSRPASMVTPRSASSRCARATPPTSSASSAGNVPDGLERLGTRYALGPAAIEQLRRLVELLASDPLAPTSIRDPARIVEDHVADSLVALDLDVLRDARRVADLGSGAGI